MHTIECSAIINEITPRFLKVSLSPQSGCGQCAKHGACALFAHQVKTIEIERDGKERIPGEEIIICLPARSGALAVALAYVFPAIILIGVLLFSSTVTQNEAVMGLWAVGVLCVYYGVLWLFNRRIQNAVACSIKAVNEDE